MFKQFFFVRPRETESTQCTANSNAWRNFKPVTGYNMFHIKLPCKLVKRPRIFLKVCTQQKTTQSRMFKCIDAQSTALAVAIAIYTCVATCNKITI